MSDVMIADAAERDAALDPTRSFIVQAPAGSGKTELLTRRFLALLARVENPEEILAITFTRKAAAEMRLRILETLENAENAPEPSNDFEREGLALAQAAARQDALHGWQLRENPSRLRVQTIDAFCASLVRRMPIITGLGAAPQVSDNSNELYDLAVDQMLRDDLQEGQNEALHTLLTFLDNRTGNLRKLLRDMLAKRDQWRKHLSAQEMGEAERDYFESVMLREVQSHFTALDEIFPAEFKNEILYCYHMSRFCLIRDKGDAISDEYLYLESFPAIEPANVGFIAEISRFLLTSGKLRKSVTKTQGFPKADAKEALKYELTVEELRDSKARMTTLLGALGANPEFAAKLDYCAGLPTGRYADEQWMLLRALTQVLKLAEGYLVVVFGEHAAADHAEIARRAGEALGSTDEPTDLALSLEYRLRHLLIDEFQDTSSGQFALFEKVVAGWNEGDGHTFFAVGDPMQSIYRFREAQVGLFLKARAEGIGGVRLEPLTLSVNFRSRPAIIDWVNTAFGEIFPTEDDRHTGAVTYSPSAAQRDDGGVDSFVMPRFLPDADARAEAAQIGAICTNTLAAYPEQAIAILLRTKAQAAPIIEQLQERGIAYSAVEIDRLQDRAVVRDLDALLRALLHPSDRIHWLALLRAPFVGLKLDDLHSLLQGQRFSTVWSCLNNPENVATLSDDAQARVARVVEVMTPAMRTRLRGRLAPWVRDIWERLGGRYCISDAVDHAAADSALAVIRDLEASGQLLDLKVLSQRLSELYAPPDTSPDVRVQLMSIHKSKGLEFGTVILPGLSRAGQNDTKQLLNWCELAGEGESSDLLLAPIDATEEKDPILRMVMNFNKTQTANELLRLLYVATTRARERLYLTCWLQRKKDGSLSSPRAGSLLKALEPAVAEALKAAEDRLAPAPAEDDEAEAALPPLRRLPAGWQAPASDKAVFESDLPQPVALEDSELEFLWAGATARHVGTVVHRQLQRISEEGIESWDAARVSADEALHARLLQREGVSESELPAAVARVREVMLGALADERGRWVLSGAHDSAVSEYALTGVHEGRLVNIIIDRTFIDDAGQRWIIDYKTGRHGGGDLTGFIDNEQARYQPQLERYASLFRELEDRPVRLGLYFPEYGQWREWAPQD